MLIKLFINISRKITQNNILIKNISIESSLQESPSIMINFSDKK